MESKKILRFDSLGDIRKEQTRIQHLRRAARGQVVAEEPGILPLSKEDALPALLREEIIAFVEQTEASGALLAEEAERWTAQGILDYWTDVLERAGVSRAAAALDPFDPAELPEIPDDKCPFVGLDAFGESQASRFFGRSAAIQELAKFVENHRLITVVGSSGSGKSSLVSAGLIPLLRAAAERGTTPWQILPTMVPGESPDVALRALLDESLSDKNPASSAERLLALGKGKRLLLFVDQFEELFTVCESEEKRRAFAAELVRLSTSPSAQHTVILTLRSDFEQQIASLPELHALYPAGRFALGVMMEDELREAIERPARAVNLRFEDGLVKQILRDVSTESAALPLLQFTLLQLWKRRRGNLVLRESYEALHGAAGAVREVADQVYRDLKLPEKQEVARRIFLRLTYPKEGRYEVFRQRLRRSEIIRDERPDYADDVIRDFVAARLLRRVPGQTPDSEQIEVAHEALVRNWKTLLDWIDLSKQDVVTRRRLDFMVEEWIRLGEAEAGCLDAVQLNEAKVWVSSDRAKLHGYHKRLPDLIAKSAALQDEASQKETKQRRRTQRIVLSLSAVVVAAAMMVAWSYKRRTDLEKQASSNAEKEAKLAKDLTAARQKSVQAMRMIGEDPLKALALIGEASQLPHYESRTLLYRLLGHPLPTAKLTGHSAAINALEVSPLGTLLLSAAEDKRVRLWNLRGQTLAQLSCHTQGVNGARFHPSFGKNPEILTYGDDGKVLLWKPRNPPRASAAMGLPSGEMSEAVNLPKDGFSTEQVNLAKSAGDSATKLDCSAQEVTVGTSAVVQEAISKSKDDSATQRILWADWSPSAEFIAYRSELGKLGSDTGALSFVRAAGGQPEVLAATNVARAFFLPGDGATLVWQDTEDGVHLCNLTSCQPVKLGLPGDFRNLYLDRLSGRMGVVAFANSVRNPDKGGPARNPKQTPLPLEPARIWAWDRNGQPRLSVDGFRHEDLLTISDISWSPDGSTLLIVGRESRDPGVEKLSLWRIENGALGKIPWAPSTVTMPLLAPPPPPQARAGSQTPQRSNATATTNATAPKSAARPASPPARTNLLAQFSPDGRYIVACDKERRVLLYERSAEGPSYRVSAVLGPFVRQWTRCFFGGDGKRILLGYSGEPGLHVFDTAGHFVTDIADGFPRVLVRTDYYVTQRVSSERLLWRFARPPIPMLSSAQDNVNFAVTDRNETKLVTASGNTLFLWNDKGEQVGRTRSLTDQVMSLRISDDGQRVLAMTSSDRMRCWLWDLTTDSDPVAIDTGDEIGLLFLVPPRRKRPALADSVVAEKCGQWSDSGVRLPVDALIWKLLRRKCLRSGNDLLPNTRGCRIGRDTDGADAQVASVRLERNADQGTATTGRFLSPDAADHGIFVTLSAKTVLRFDSRGMPLAIPNGMRVADKPLLTVSDTGQYIALSGSLSESPGVWLWDTRAGGPPRHLQATSGVRKILIHETSRALAMETEQKRVLIWDLSKDIDRPVRRASGRLIAVAAEVANRPWLFMQERDGSLLMWHVRDGVHHRFATLREDWSIDDVLVSPSGRFLVPLSTVRFSIDSSRRVRTSHVWPLDESRLSTQMDMVVKSRSLRDADDGASQDQEDEEQEKDELLNQLGD
ncbi:MAG: WD40 repeat domain-containing protein [Polyangia bacterium]